ncbi:shikimate kinase [Alkalihalobacterium elongatum]|uniref:shikimate kinase n=1 Tax=Alkalihalobacterium elongatum TaxID=2675466 RepID=UPI001C2005DF|nr:shikimate kinase [Alkalihalobacterium elongatum]
MDRDYKGVNIFLTGFMGAGKSSVGKILAQNIKFRLVDTDEWIESTLGKSISSIFSEEGEAAFRSYETNALNSLPTGDLIVTTGGGIVVNEHNRKIMRDKGIIIYLHCDIEEVLKRTRGDTTRPLLQNKTKEQVNELFKQRKSYYEDAHYQIDTTNLTINEIVEQIILIVNEHKSKCQ